MRRLNESVLSPSIHQFDDVFIYLGRSAALGHELGPNGVSIWLSHTNQNILLYLRIEALSLEWILAATSDAEGIYS
jgi:hypothetical protein